MEKHREPLEIRESMVECFDRAMYDNLFVDTPLQSMMKRRFPTPPERKVDRYGPITGHYLDKYRKDAGHG